MASEIKALQKDLRLHQEVEKELAKRSHFCNKVIKKYQEQLKTLKAQLLDVQNGNYEVGTLNEGPPGEDSDELAGFLERRIAEIEEKLRAA